MDAVDVEFKYTVDDIIALPKGQRAELIDGVWYDLASPRPYHQELCGFLVRKIGNYIEAHHGNCKVYPAPFAVRLEDDEQNYVEPDVSVVCDQSKIDDTGCNGAPDWVIEILSPGTRVKDQTTKRDKYMASGVREYWVVDPENEKVVVYPLETMKAEANPVALVGLYTFEDEVSSVIFPELVIKDIPKKNK